MDIKTEIAQFRFYEELNEFLPECKKKISFPHSFQSPENIKTAIESEGVPSCQTDLILVNGRSVDFDYQLKNSDIASIYPVFESIDISEITELRARPLRRLKFILDRDLFQLWNLMNISGFDAIYNNSYDDAELCRISARDKRTILTPHRHFLMQNEVNRAYRINTSDPQKQLSEVLKRFDLKSAVNTDRQI